MFDVDIFKKKKKKEEADVLPAFCKIYTFVVLSYRPDSFILYPFIRKKIPKHTEKERRPSTFDKLNVTNSTNCPGIGNNKRHLSRTIFTLHLNRNSRRNPLRKSCVSRFSGQEAEAKKFSSARLTEVPPLSLKLIERGGGGRGKR